MYIRTYMNAHMRNVCSYVHMYTESRERHVNSMLHSLWDK